MLPKILHIFGFFSIFEGKEEIQVPNISVFLNEADIFQSCVSFWIIILEMRFLIKALVNVYELVPFSYLLAVPVSNIFKFNAFNYQYQLYFLNSMSTLLLMVMLAFRPTPEDFIET